MSRRPPEPMRPWSDDERDELQRYFDNIKTAPPPTRNEVLGAFPERAVAG